ncbi:hypothetical protein CKAN_00014000 [Cinnamomum micranthum f. kanehirae]|uniref:Uncharacterized protein n=1 Tax=Cinnamomum micranthum f. kanehirae TaxID=337451 RepID=A0A443N0A5_9MAGN|nr:hypothetical protein CKAN_00014000 [Cinnamomum micranthum f. kanehirae]
MRSLEIFDGFLRRKAGFSGGEEPVRRKKKHFAAVKVKPKFPSFPFHAELGFFFSFSRTARFPKLPPPLFSSHIRLHPPSPPFTAANVCGLSFSAQAQGCMLYPESQIEI